MLYEALEACVKVMDKIPCHRPDDNYHAYTAAVAALKLAKNSEGDL
jgi:hypothetical protein